MIQVFFRLILVVALAGRLVDGAEPGGVKMLQRCRAILNLSEEELAKNPTVELAAVVTWVEPSGGMLFIHDGTAGIFVFGIQTFSELGTGVRVSIRGEARAGRYAPILQAKSLLVLGSGELPPAETVTLTQLSSGAFDSQWVSFQGVVRHDGHDWLHRALQLSAGDQEILVRVQGFEHTAPTNLLDARVEVRGVVSMHYDDRGVRRGIGIYSPGPPFVRVTTPPIADPFLAPLVKLSELHRWSADYRQEHLRRVRGTVSAQMPGRWVTLQMGKESLVVESVATNRLESGEAIEAAGFVSAGSGAPVLRHALWRRTGTRGELSPRNLAGEGDLVQASAGELVRFAAVLRAGGGGAEGAEAVFQFGPTMLAVHMRRDTPAETWQEGATYELTGVRGPAPDAAAMPGLLQSFWPTGAEGVRMLRPAHRATMERFPWRDLWWAGLFGTALVGWWWQHRRQRATLDELDATLAFNRARLIQAESEQARIARDLHDGVIQSIYAVGMRIEECRRLAATAPMMASEKLATTSEALNHVIRDMRGFLTGLESASIQGRELKTALKSVLLGLGDAAAGRIVLEIDAHTASSLTSKEATELFHICKEAISNSLRHGRAERVEVCLETTPAGRRVEISDNGCGFDPAEVSVESRGLQNMQARARNLAGHLQVTTARGGGTRLVVTLPNS